MMQSNMEMMQSILSKIRKRNKNKAFVNNSQTGNQEYTEQPVTSGPPSVLVKESEKPAEGNAPEGDAPEGDAPEGDAPEGDAPEGDAPGGDAPEGDAPEEVSEMYWVQMMKRMILKIIWKKDLLI